MIKQTNTIYMCDNCGNEVSENWNLRPELTNVHFMHKGAMRAGEGFDFCFDCYQTYVIPFVNLLHKCAENRE